MGWVWGCGGVCWFMVICRSNRADSSSWSLVLLSETERPHYTESWLDYCCIVLRRIRRGLYLCAVGVLDEGGEGERDVGDVAAEGALV